MHPLDILNSICRQHTPESTEKEIFESFLGRLTQDDHAIREVAYSWFREHFKRIELIATTAGEYEPQPVPTRPASTRSEGVSAPVPKPQVPPKQREREKEAGTKWKDEVRAAVAMTSIMPNKMPLQDCDAGYVRKLGGVFTALVKGLPDNIRVGLRRTNDDLQNLCKRHKMKMT